ncbi:MAG: cobalamin-dependent protein [Candidatus Woesearchaeota archaeon]
MSRIALFQGIDKEGDRYGAPLGIHSIASWVRARGHEADVIDPNIESYLSGAEPERIVLDSLEAKKYDMVGISSMYFTAPHDFFASHLIKRKYPEMPIIFGGIEPTFNREDVSKGSLADLIVMGEGEKPTTDIMNIADNLKQRYGKVDARQLRKEVSGIKGLYLMDEERKGIFTGPRESLDADEFRDARMNIDYSRIPFDSYKQAVGKLIVAVTGSNHCPAKCAFCASTNFHEESSGKRPKMHNLSSDELFSLVSDLVKLRPDISTLYFNDDNFLYGKRLQDRAKGYFSKMIDSGLKIPQLLQSRVDTISPSLLETAFEAGVEMIGYGVENFSDSGLLSLNKRIDVDTIVDTLDATLDAGIAPWSNVILGTPHVDVAGIRDNLQAFMIYWETGSPIAAYPFVIPFEGSWYSRNEPYRSDMIRESYTVGDTGISIERGSRLKVYDSAAEELLLAAVDKYKPKRDSWVKEVTGMENLPSYLESGTLAMSILDSANHLGIDIWGDTDEIDRFDQADIANAFISDDLKYD